MEEAAGRHRDALPWDKAGLEAEIVRQIEATGRRVLDGNAATQGDAQLAPLYLAFRGQPDVPGSHIFNVLVELRQRVRVNFSLPAEAPALELPTWDNYRYGVAQDRYLVSLLRPEILKMVEEFIEDLLLASKLGGWAEGVNGGQSWPLKTRW